MSQTEAQDDRPPAFGGAIWEREAFRVGVLLDQAMGTPVPGHFVKAMQLALDEARANGLLPKPVELVVRECNGLPFGRFDNVLTAWQELVHDAHCLLVAGPWLSENALALHETIERDKVPSLSMASAMEWHGEHCFAFQNGAPPEDAALIIDWLVGAGLTNVALVRETNTFGDGYYTYLRVQARRHGVRFVADHPITPGEDAGVLLEALRRTEAQAFVYVGYGFEGQDLTRLVGKSDWPVAKIVGSILMGATTPDYGYGYELADFEGWIGVDQYDERNPLTVAMLDRYEDRYGERPRHSYTTHGFDWGNTIAEALAVARPATPAGVRRALELVRNLPATTGGAGTTIGFGPHDHRAFKGGSWVSLSTVRDGVVHKI